MHPTLEGGIKGLRQGLGSPEVLTVKSRVSNDYSSLEEGQMNFIQKFQGRSLQNLMTAWEDG